jgi:hypothetical protein
MLGSTIMIINKLVESIAFSTRLFKIFKCFKFNFEMDIKNDIPSIST